MNLEFLNIWFIVGIIFCALTIIMYFYDNRHLKLKIHQYVRTLVSKDKEHPTIEHIIRKEFGYRVLIKLPECISMDQFVARQEALEYYLSYKVAINRQEDLLVLDVIKNEHLYRLQKNDVLP